MLTARLADGRPELPDRSFDGTLHLIKSKSIWKSTAGSRWGEVWGGGGCPSCSPAGKQSSGWCHKGEKLKSNPKLPQSLPERLGAEPWGRALSSWGGLRGGTRAWHSSCAGMRACSSFEELAPAVISAGSNAAQSPAVPRAPRGKWAFGDPVLLCTELGRCCMGGGGCWGSYFCVMEGLESNAPDGEGRTAPIYKHAGST